jgi:hypothetical protein
MDDELRRRTLQLAERVKELDCLYGIANLIETPDISIEGIMRGACELLPRAWQYPSLACARIVLKGRTYETANFRQTEFRLLSGIRVLGEAAGTVEVCYFRDPHPPGREPFLKEEVKLLDAIAKRLGRVTERMQAVEERERLIDDLQEALQDVKRLSGLLPICATCKKIRDDQGYWSQIESYLSAHSEAEFTHGICPDCLRAMYASLGDDPSRRP